MPFTDIKVVIFMCCVAGLLTLTTVSLHSGVTWSCSVTEANVLRQTELNFLSMPNCLPKPTFSYIEDLNMRLDNGFG